MRLGGRLCVLNPTLVGTRGLKRGYGRMYWNVIVKRILTYSDGFRAWRLFSSKGILGPMDDVR